MSKTESFEMHILSAVPNAQAYLEEASFLSIEAHGEVWIASGDSIYALVDAESANEWAIVASFPNKPGRVTLSFEPKDLNAALNALLFYKRSRPLFYLDSNYKFELIGDSTADLVAAIRAKTVDPCLLLEF